MQHQTTPPSPAQLARYNINIPGNFSGITFPLFDSVAYPAAGTAQLTLFQTPAGQGGKTLADTNMQAAGQVPSPNVFVVTGLALKFISGAPVELLGAAAAIDYVADVHAFYNGLTAGATLVGSYLEFASGSSYYVREPLWMFPPAARLAISGASSNASTAAASQFYVTEFAENSGIPYEIAPLALPANQTFQVTLNWPGGVVAMPSTKAGRAIAVLNGWMYRPTQG